MNVLALQRTVQSSENLHQPVPVKDKKKAPFGVPSRNQIKSTNSSNEQNALLANAQPPSNMDHHLDVTVYTQNKEDCQWGVFDFSSVAIEKTTGKVKFKKKNDELDDLFSMFRKCISSDDSKDGLPSGIE
jgi:hypothetical protein